MTTIYYATQTGNAEECAEWLKEYLSVREIEVQIRNLVDVEASEIQKDEVALFVVSTYGEGDPPDDAFDFYESLQKMPEESLDGVRYAVFALGDIDYVLFCGFGNNCDQLLEEAGAEQMLEVEECNLDQAERLPVWANRIVKLLQ